jgi:predicted nucleic acid-binding Zn ribbon protein
MKCENCGASVPRDLGACPECGVFARVLKQKKEKKKSNTRLWVLMLLLIALAVAATTYWVTRPTVVPKKPAPLPVRVVHDRPGGARSGSGAKVSEPEAILYLQRSLGLKVDCIAIMSNGFRDGAYQLTAVDRCEGTRLGKWRVDGKTGAVRRAF